MRAARRVNHILGIGYIVDTKENLCSADVEGEPE